MKESQLNRIALALEHQEVISAVTLISSKYELQFRDITSFEYECYARIGKAIEHYGTSIRNLTSYAKRICGKVAKVHKERRSIQETVPLDEVFEIIEHQSVLANAEDVMFEEISLTEKISLLAQRDSRKEFVLNAWASGISNDLDLSRMLAHSIGGSIEGHRTFVKRFKNKCQTKLAEIA